MAQLNLIGKYDEVLNALYDMSGRRPSFERIQMLLQIRGFEIDWGETRDIINKMIEEKFIETVTDNTSRYPNEILHLLKFEGKLYKEKGGLKGYLERTKSKWHQKHPVLFGIMSAIGGAILTLIVGLILWRVDKQSENQETQQLKQTIQDVNHRVDSLNDVLKNMPDFLKTE